MSLYIKAYDTIRQRQESILLYYTNKMLLLSKMLDMCHYGNTLGRGFALVRDEHGVLISSRAGAIGLKHLEIEFVDGALAVVPAAGGARLAATNSRKIDDKGHKLPHLPEQLSFL